MNEKRLIRLANMPSNDEWDRLYPPEWAAGRELSRGGLELGYGMSHHPGPFTMADVAEVVVTRTDADPDNYNDRSWEWEVTLHDGRRFHVEGWHDYSGWDCQSGLVATEIVSGRAAQEGEKKT